MKEAYFLIIFIFYSVNIIAQDTSNFTDPRDGQTYKTIKLGEQIWMSSNLLFETPKGSWCYNDEEKFCYKYGRLYNWETANNVCPDGWRLPGKEDWGVLIKNFDVKHKKNKPSRLAYAQMIQDGASGFNALFGGLRTTVLSYTPLLHTPIAPTNLYKLYQEIDFSGNFWTSDKSIGLTAWCLQMKFKNSMFTTYNKGFGLSVRCLKNDSTESLNQ